jgi:hypothetical protein
MHVDGQADAAVTDHGEAKFLYPHRLSLGGYSLVRKVTP